MKWFGFCLLLLILSSCGTPTTSHNIADGATNSANALEQSLSKDCATSAIKTQITAIKTQIKAIVSACDTEKQVINQEKIRWKWSFLGLLIVVSMFVLRKVVK